MENITIGHWIFAMISSFLYLAYCVWGYKKEQPLYKKFNYRILPVIIYVGLILFFLVIIS